MPDFKGRMNGQERTFVKTYVDTGNAAYAAEKAGYSSPRQRASQNLAKPAVQEEIRRQQIARLSNELLPLALDTLEAVLRDPRASERGKLTAAKIVTDKAIQTGQDGLSSKEPHEMTGDELQAAIDRLRREASERSRPVIDAEPVEQPLIEAPEPSIFG